MEYFLPWEGKNYKSDKKRLMILGESHYGYKGVKDWTGATKDVVRDYLNNINKENNYWKRFFTSLTKICLNTRDKISSVDKNNFWNSIIYYNYITESLGKPGDRPTPKQFVDGVQAFEKVLNEYKPNYILVCGRQLWFGIPEEFGEKGPEDYFWYFPIGNGKRAISSYIYHPSRNPSGYKGRDSREIYKKLSSY